MVKVFPDGESVARAAVAIFIDRCKSAVARSDRFSVVLSGGHTPLRTYELLSQEPFSNQVDWSRVHVFWGDERCVPSTDAKSNFGAAAEKLLSHVPIPPAQVHPICCDVAPSASAIAYESVLKRYFGTSSPLFDLVFLGLGRDGHTASLFPGSPALDETGKWVVQCQKPTEDFARMTLTASRLNLSRTVLFMVTGIEKANVLLKVLDGVGAGPPLPAQLIDPVGKDLIWLADQAATSTP